MLLKRLLEEAEDECREAIDYVSASNVGDRGTEALSRVTEAFDLLQEALIIRGEGTDLSKALVGRDNSIKELMRLCIQVGYRKKIEEFLDSEEFEEEAKAFCQIRMMS